MRGRRAVSIAAVSFVATSLGIAQSAHGKAFIAKDGQPRAEIVISEQPPRMAKLAAEELQKYVGKITGATLPIVTTPGNRLPVRVYVGQSEHTDRLKITAEAVKYGGFRMVSGENWLSLVGPDSNFTPLELYERSPNDRERVMREWDALTGAKWGNPVGSALRRRHNRDMGIWAGERGDEGVH